MTEASLIQNLKAGGEQAFRIFVETYQGRVYNTCLGFLRNEEDAEDIAQEVFMEVFNSISKFQENASLATWLYRIATNKCLELIRSRKRKKRFAFLEVLTGGHEAVTASPKDHPGVQLENRERAMILFGAIDKLPDNQRIAFTLHKVEGLSYAEISKVMEVSLSSVESLIFRARKKLRKELFNYYQNTG